MFIGILLVARLFFIAATYWPMGKALKKSIETSHQQYILEIFCVIQEEKSLSVPIEKLDFKTKTSREGEKKDNSTNTFEMAFYQDRWIIPGLYYIVNESKLYTKYFISNDGEVIVYSYYFPNVGKNILVTKTKKAPFRTSDSSYIFKEGYEQFYLTEQEFLPILKEFGKDKL